MEVKEGVIESVYFHGYGCAISKASTSVLAKNLEGKTVAEALAICETFEGIVSPNADTENENEELEAFAAAKDFPGRLQCATLSWEAMKAFLSTAKS